MSAGTRAITQPAIDAVAATDAAGRVKAALYLAIAAPESQVLR
jgi:hypothetical protein